jgi:hypothetical protein
MRYRLRTLLILTILGPPVLAGWWFGWMAYREHQRPRPTVDWMTVTVPLIIGEEESITGTKIPAKP